MPNDVVVDANIFGHAINPNNNFHDSALTYIVGLIKSETELALDDSGKRAPAIETSHMYQEYLPFLTVGSLGRVLIENAALSGRLVFYARLKGQSKSICQSLVPANAKDQIVLGVGVSSKSKILVTNDYDDFDEKMRRKALRELGVQVVDSDEVLPEKVSPALNP